MLIVQVRLAIQKGSPANFAPIAVAEQAQCGMAPVDAAIVKSLKFGAVPDDFRTTTVNTVFFWGRPVCLDRVARIVDLRLHYPQ